MGGKIGVESEVGTRLGVLVHRAAAGAEVGRTADIVPVDVTGARVLVIDDNAVNREILLEQMTQLGVRLRARPKAAPIGPGLPRSRAASSAPRSTASSSTTRCRA